MTKIMEPILGIDLGTTNSLAAIVRDGKPQVLPARSGGNLIPSVVTFGKDHILVGKEARAMKVRDAAHTVYSVKRLLGRGFGDISDSSSEVPYEIIPGEGAVRIRAGDRAYSPVEISAMILREVKASAETALGQTLRKAVVTVPAYFNDSQRQATRAAARLAGLDVLRIINEPTAAALAYGLDKKKQGLIAVYDLGGGTFDVSILKLHDGIFEVLATGGDTRLGGDDLDIALANLIAPNLAEAWGCDPWSSSSTKALLLEAAEAAKISFSEEERTSVKVERDGFEPVTLEIHRRDFESIARPVLEKTRKPCLQAIRDAGIRSEDLSDVILVGGPTRLAVVRETARSIFGRDPNVSVHPDEVVAQGAAIQADILSGANRELLLLDVVPLSLGIETYGGVMSPLITRNTKIPTVAREQFTTYVENQTAVDIHVLQGERERSEDNRSLARFKLKGIPAGPAGLPRIEVTFLVDADGILEVTAQDLKTGKEQSIEVRPSFGLSDAEVDRMVAESAENAEEDIKYRLWIEAKNGAEPVLRAAEKALPDAYRLLSVDEARSVTAAVDGLKAALESRSPEAVNQAKEKLNSVTVRLAELLLRESLRTAAREG